MPSFPLDLQTLALVLILVTAFLSGVIIFVRLSQKTYSGFNLWVISNITVAIGIFVLAFNGFWSDITGTALTFGAVLIGYEGNRSFLKLTNSAKFSAGIFVLHATVLLYLKTLDDLVSQVSFTSVLVGVVSVLCGYIFFKQSSERTKFSYLFTGTTYFIFALIMFARAGITIHAGTKVDFYQPNGIQPMFFILYILFEIVWTFNYINLNGNRLYNDLEQAQSELEKIATTDFLTGINNQRNFFAIGEKEIQRAHRFRHPLGIIMFDIDYFKLVNDRYGHAAGDTVLIEIVKICRQTLRTTDVFGRLGGEEFGILLPHTDADGAQTVAEYLRSAIEATAIICGNEALRVTASFGITEFGGADVIIKDLLDRADRLLYQAKNQGRNRTASDRGFDGQVTNELALA